MDRREICHQQDWFSILTSESQFVISKVHLCFIICCHSWWQHILRQYSLIDKYKTWLKCTNTMSLVVSCVFKCTALSIPEPPSVPPPPPPPPTSRTRNPSPINIMAAGHLSHNALSLLDPPDCGCPGGQGPSADYHEAADWIVFLIPGGWTLQEHPHPGVRLLSAGQATRVKSVIASVAFACKRFSWSSNTCLCDWETKPHCLSPWPRRRRSSRSDCCERRCSFSSFLPSWQIMKYSEQRIPTLNEYCVVCDEQHVFQNGSMLKVGLDESVCSWQGGQMTWTWVPCPMGQNIIIKDALNSTNKNPSRAFFVKVCVQIRSVFEMLAFCDVTMGIKWLT